METIKIIGGGLAGCEAAYQLLKRGYTVQLYEMRKVKMTPCHHTDKLAELVCSNSLKSMLEDTASGCLKAELRQLDSLLLKCADKAAVPAGGALAVNRELFSQAVEDELNSFDTFVRIDEEVTSITPDIYTVIATGPLTSEGLHRALADILDGNSALHFYDAAAPIVSGDSIDFAKAFFATRYDKGEASDYLNCGMQKDEYKIFYGALVAAEIAEIHEFDKREIFEGCMPIEVMAKRGEDTIRYGMLKPKGIVNPNNGEKYYAVAQLRKENTQGTAYNLVGFQTNLKFKEQKRVFGLIPALKNAEFLRYGVMHRNTFINAPMVLDAMFALKKYPKVYFAGQISGVEGYVESIMSGLIAAINIASKIGGKSPYIAPPTTIIGSLQRHVSTQNGDYQPMNANFGILTELTCLDGVSHVKDKKSRKSLYSKRSIRDIIDYNDSYFKE